MSPRQCSSFLVVCFSIALSVALLVVPAHGQLIDNTQAQNAINAGINKSLANEIGAGRGDVLTPDSSLFIIARDPFRAVRRGRQLFQRKFTVSQGQGPGVGDGFGNINTTLTIGAGLADSCAACHGRPRGSAGSGGDVATRPDSRDAPHLFGLGLREMLADEITADLRKIRQKAIRQAKEDGESVTLPLMSKGISFGSITANPKGSVNTAKVQGVNPDLRVRPFFAQGQTISIREFTVGALNAEMGLQAVDPDLAGANAGHIVTTPAGMVLDGTSDQIEAPPSPDPVRGNEIPTSLVDFLEFYLLNYFSPATYEETAFTDQGRTIFTQIGCAQCHVPDLQINRDRRVADVQTVFDAVRGIFNRLFATATTLTGLVNDGSSFPPLKPPLFQPFLVKNIFTDFKRHDVGPNFSERNYDGSFQTQFLTRPLWGVGTTAPYGHDGRSINLTEVILRHGGEAQAARNAFAALALEYQNVVLDFLNSLVLFPPDDTASNLDPGNPSAANFPQAGHGSIKLGVLFNNPSDPE
ncbi:MAG: thiol oxidoreductase-like protein [Candidatus Rokuibacteriota bacterium]|nr:MAG: thiol oxidoreductase-like protein [Candidatus Rokubacteria bacterium]